MSQQSNEIEVIASGKLLEELFELQDKIHKEERNPKYIVDDIITHLITIFTKLEKIETEGFNTLDFTYLQPEFEEINQLVGKTYVLLIELCRVSNIEVDDIKTYYENLLTQENLLEAFLFPKNILLTIFSFARHINIQERRINTGKLLTDTLPIFDEGVENYKGLYKYTIGTDSQISNLSWEIIIRGKNLKMENETYHYTVMEIFLLIHQLFDLCYFNHINIYRQTKQQINGNS